MATTYSDFIRRQTQWAIREGLEVDGDYLGLYDDNLFEPLSPQALIDFTDADGGELKSNMRTLCSSPALAVNVFHYWSRINWLARKPMHEAFGDVRAKSDIRFEYKLQYPLTDRPKIDVALIVCDESEQDSTAAIYAIESSLTEWITSKRYDFGRGYFHGVDLWTQANLPQCQSLVQDIYDGRQEFNYLRADQLLKHALGLATEFQGRSQLLYLYYDLADEPVCQDHRDEIDQFRSRVGDEIHFKPMTYQDLFQTLVESCGTNHKTYMDYLAMRYF